MRRFALLWVVIGLLSPAMAAGAATRSLSFHGIGPRVGFSINPDQFVFGGQVDLGDLFPKTALILPVEVGLGDHQTVTSLGADILYRFTDRWGVWTPYLGGEVDFLIRNVDTGGLSDKTDTDMGLMVVLGVNKAIGSKNTFGGEMKINLVDAPDVKFMAVWTFGR